MVYCRKCGCELDDSSLFCRICGTPVETTDSINETTANETQTTEEIQHVDQPEDSNVSNGLICKTCGNKLDISSILCVKCGTLVETNESITGQTNNELQEKNEEIQLFDQAADVNISDGLICKTCGNKLDASSIFCVKCGTTVERKESLTESVIDDNQINSEITNQSEIPAENTTRELVCLKCGNRLDETDLFCGVCGTSVNTTERSTEPIIDDENSIIQTNSNYFNSIQSDSLNDDDSETEHKKHHSAGLIIAVIILCIALLLGLVCIVLYMLNITDILQLPKSNLFIEITDNVSEITAETDSVKETGKEIQPSSMVVEVLIDNTDIKGSFEFSYDDDKLIMVSLVNDDDSVQTVNIEYDERGNRITDYSWVVVGSDLSFEKISLVTVYKYYDENNYLIKSKELGGGYQIYKNDSKGNPIHVDDYDDAFIDAPRIKYTDDSEYDELNRCTSTRRHNISDDTTRDFTYYYSESNTEPDYYTEEYDKGSSDQRTYKTIFSYEYNDDGLLTKKIEESYDPDGNVSLKFSFKYNYDLSTS